MAIPISRPSSDEMDESYLSLDVLLEQLLVTLRQIIMQRRRELALAALRQSLITTDSQCSSENNNTHQCFNIENRPRNESLHNQLQQQQQQQQQPQLQQQQQQQQQQETDVMMNVHPQLPMPDLIRHVQPDILQDIPDCERQRRKLLRRQSLTRPPVSTWIQIGAELRRIADLLREEDSHHQQNVVKTNRVDVTSSGMVSRLRLNLSAPLWTTLALIVGWSLLFRTR